MTTEGKKRANSVIAHEVVGELIGFTVEGVGTLTLDMSQMHPDVVRQAAYHGMIQRVRDAAALSRDTTTGKSASPQEKYEAMRELVEHYNSGTDQWSPARSAGGGAGGERGLLVRVIMAVAGMERSEAEAKVKGWTIAEVRLLLTSPKLKPKADELRAEGAAKVDADELLKAVGI